MQNPKLKNSNAAGACNTSSIIRKTFQTNHNTKREEGRKPSLSRKMLESVLFPLWARLPRNQGRRMFQVLGFVLGRSKFYGVIGASYLRFLIQKEAA